MGRIGTLFTKHGKVETPVLMPVIHPKIQTVTVEELVKEFKVDMLITNSYIIYKDEELNSFARKKGVHELLGYSKPIMCDSGSYQLYVYGSVNEITPDQIIKFHQELGADIGVILDIPSHPDASYKKAKNDVEETLNRAFSAKKNIEDMLIAYTVQGGKYTDLREYCARELAKLDGDVYPIGGLVPFLETYRFEELIEVVFSSKRNLPLNKPVHLFGCGHPMVFALTTALGCDLYDSASYAKYAKSDRLIFSYGTRKLEDLAEIPCFCPICVDYSANELKKLEKKDRQKLISKHNLYVCLYEIKRVKQAIREGKLWELMESRCRAHPNLFQAFLKLKNYKEIIEKYDPLIKPSALFFFSSESLNRPEIYRYSKRLKNRYLPPKSARILILLSKIGEKQYSKIYTPLIDSLSRKLGDRIANIHFAFVSIFGIIPIELENIFPVLQSLAPAELDMDVLNYIEQMILEYLSDKNYDSIIFFQVNHSLDELILKLKKKILNLLILSDLDSLKKTLAQLTIKFKGDVIDQEITCLRKIADYQFGKDAGIALFPDNQSIRFEKSKSTGKIKKIFCNENYLLTLRPDNGYFSLGIYGAKVLLKHFESPKLRVIVDDEASKFVSRGKDVFAKFILQADKEIRPKEEVIVVNQNDELLGVGKAVLNGEEMLVFNRGVAVNLRKGVEK